MMSVCMCTNINESSFSSGSSRSLIINGTINETMAWVVVVVVVVVVVNPISSGFGGHFSLFLFSADDSGNASILLSSKALI